MKIIKTMKTAFKTAAKFGDDAKTYIVCSPAKWALEAAKKVLRGVTEGMRATANAVFDVASKAITAATAIHGAAMSVMSAVTSAIGRHIGVDYFMVEGTLSTNFWQSSLGGRLKFHIGGAKIDISGRFTLGNVKKTIEAMFQKAVAWFRQHLNPMKLISGLMNKINDYRSTEATKGGAADNMMKGVQALMNLGSLIMRFKDILLALAKGVDKMFQKMGKSLIRRMMVACEKEGRTGECSNAQKFKKQWGENYKQGEAEFRTKRAAAGLDLLQTSDTSPTNKTDYLPFLEFMLDLPIFDDTIDASLAYANKLLETA